MKFRINLQIAVVGNIEQHFFFKMLATTYLIGYFIEVGSKHIDGIRFQMYSDDHLPVHAHAFVGGHEIVVTLILGKFRVSRRTRATESDVRKVLAAANRAKDELVALWESIH